MLDGQDAFSVGSRTQSPSIHHPHFLLHIELRFEFFGGASLPELPERAVNQLIQEVVVSGSLFACHDEEKFVPGIVVPNPNSLSFWIFEVAHEEPLSEFCYNTCCSAQELCYIMRPEHINEGCHDMRCIHNLIYRIHSGERNSDRTSCFFCGEPHRCKHMAWLGLMALAGRTGRYADIHVVQHQDEGLIINTIEPEIDSLAGSQKGCAIDMYGIVSEVALKLCHKSLFKHGDRGSVLGELGTGELTRLPEPHNTSYVLRPTSEPELLVVAATDERRQERRVFDIERSNTLGAVDFMGGDGEEAAPDVSHVDGVAPCGLHTVRMEQDAVLQADAPDVVHRILHTSFIVDVHHRYQSGICPQCPLNSRRRHGSVAEYRNIFDIKSVFGKAFCGPENAVVLHGGNQDMRASNTLEIVLHPMEHEVVGLTAARGEDDVVLVPAEELRRPCSGFLNRLVCRPSKLVECTGVSIMGRQVRHHSFQDPRVELRSSSVV